MTNCPPKKGKKVIISSSFLNPWGSVYLSSPVSLSKRTRNETFPNYDGAFPNKDNTKLNNWFFLSWLKRKKNTWKRIFFIVQKWIQFWMESRWKEEVEKVKICTNKNIIGILIDTLFHFLYVKQKHMKFHTEFQSSHYYKPNLLAD